jgi:lipoprotein-anchoring transpeptidase ErfK/SrfK
MITRRFLCTSGLMTLAAGVSGCSSMGVLPELDDRREARPHFSTRTVYRPNYRQVYGAIESERTPILAFNFTVLDPKFLRQTVTFPTDEPIGTIFVDPGAHHLYFVEARGHATRYGVGVGKEGFGWNGRAKINMKRDWPDWVPPHEMVMRSPEIRAQLEPTPRGMGVRGGPKSPLGARAMYLFGPHGDLGYRIHGTTEPETIGSNVSSGCIRMINQDIIHLYSRAAIGTPVIVMA